MGSEYQMEQQRLDDVLKIIQEQIHKSEEETSERRDEVVNIRKHFWDEVKVNLDSFDDYLETIIGLRQEAQALSVTQSTHRQASKKLATLRRMEKSPYFGRIDFKEKGDADAEEIYIGIGTLTNDSGDQFIIYDWRAPISSVYYDYQPGAAQYETPGGTIEGTLEKKWQYLIKDGALESMFDTSLTIGDEILQQVLGKGTDKHMHHIAATIQQDQNQIIRHDHGRLLIVQGAAGSGKTSAALQRIAYLLYKYRDSLNANQIILFSPNAMFKSYVSNVLPELGEENMQQVTFQEYLNHRLGKIFEVENPYEQLEYVLTSAKDPDYPARVEGIRFKASTSFFHAMEAYRQSLEAEGMQFKSLQFRGQTILSAEQISGVFYSQDTSLRFHNRLEKLRDYLLKQIKEAQIAERKADWVQDEIELLSDDAYYKAQRYLAKKKGYEREELAEYEPDRKDLARLIVQQKFKPLRKRVRAYEFIDMKAIYKQLFASSHPIEQWLDREIPAAWSDICEATITAIDVGKLPYEDATPYLLLNELIQGFQTNRNIKHIVVDEAQDYSPFQFEYMRRLFPAARMTVLGDFNQAIFAHAADQVDFHMLMGLYGPERTGLINLARSYRSTKPIIEFTRRLVPNGDHIIPFDRDGKRPAMKQLENHDELHQCIVEQVAALRNENYQSIAIICKSAAESASAFEALSAIEGIKLLKTGTLEYEQGVVVVPSYLSKGIEFDAVIVYDASANVYDHEGLRRIFYTVCTRAMHHLQLYSVGEPSLLLQQALERDVVEG
ncbi:AAA family ATPase [Ornithinibacillus gellani]|uniref:RNA polymerase recycling motor HelD n=1 Tax=Ornithinibacillus gellani TaxID=2293253 RepID=UPI000F485DA5|nr:RNA polymerase recycling motor HelD [Ornithinibacillus gellani]TQS75066.1 AAA family ATPase [Ornithinibacillus gellani]